MTVKTVTDKKRDKKKKKKVPKIVSFDDLEPASSSSTSSLTSPKVFLAGRAQHSDSFEDSSCLSSPTSMCVCVLYVKRFYMLTSNE